MTTAPRLAAVILAAGSGRRFGGRKQLARLGNRTMLELVVAIAADAGLDPILAVVPPELAVPPEAVAVPNAEPERGLSRSLQLGIRAVPPDANAAVILLGDQPTLSPEIVRAVVAARGTRPVVVARANGIAAPPVLIERERFGVVDGLSADVGLREVLATNAELLHAVDVGEHAPDVDTPADLARIGHMFDSAAEGPDR